ncbi:MAG: DNA methyltransferase [Candidatus Dojkabacteria bacterium]|jgi:tRNA G10  N-methylase Trm11
MPMHYFFQAGTFPALSYVELIALFNIYNLNSDTIHRYSDNIFIIKSKEISEETLLKIFNRSGGFVRFGHIINNLDSFLNEYIELKEKVVFGVSVLGSNRKGNLKYIKKLSNEIKRGLKGYGISSRFLIPSKEDTELNAAQIINNDVLSKGFELLILKDNKEEIYAETLEIQDLEGYIERDMDRPYSDTEMGVLPPKLARMMVNYASMKEGIVWDPFCGSGTVLMESAVLGYNFLGSDINKDALKYSEENILWLNERGYMGDVLYEIFEFDVKNPDKEKVKKLRNTNISAIVCEPFMGPPLKRAISHQHAQQLLDEVKDLYINLFNTLDKKIGVRGVNMVMIIPSYKTDKGWKTFGIREVASKRWELLNTQYSPSRDLKWSRKNSIITRNIFILHRT